MKVSYLRNLKIKSHNKHHYSTTKYSSSYNTIYDIKIRVMKRNQQQPSTYYKKKLNNKCIKYSTRTKYGSTC